MDETLAERLWGLTEMFPAPVRKGVGSLTGFVWTATKATLGFTQQALWIASTTATVMLLPYLVEKERTEVEAAQLQQQRQLLLGPTAAVSQIQPRG
jgi:mitochondrial import receptor subunit TOM22